MATFATTLCLTLGALFGDEHERMAWQRKRCARAAAACGVSVTLEVEPVGHVIWLGSKLPNVKRVFLHLNQELLHLYGCAQALVRIFSCEPARYFYCVRAAS